MQTAGFPQLVKSLLTLVLIYYVIKFLARLFLPLIAKKVVEKAAEQFKDQQQRGKQTPSGQDTLKTDKPKATKKVGDYVDFEEID